MQNPLEFEIEFCQRKAIANAKFRYSTLEVGRLKLNSKLQYSYTFL